MKFLPLTLGITASVIALGVTGIAAAAPAANTGARPAIVTAKAESAASGSSADRRARARHDRHDSDRERSHDPRIKKTKHSR